jgi:hypothetical protein
MRKKLNIKGFYTQIGDGEVAGQEGECVNNRLAEP